MYCCTDARVNTWTEALIEPREINALVFRVVNPLADWLPIWSLGIYFALLGCTLGCHVLRHVYGTSCHWGLESNRPEEGYRSTLTIIGTRRTSMTHKRFPNQQEHSGHSHLFSSIRKEQRGLNQHRNFQGDIYGSSWDWLARLSHFQMRPILNPYIMAVKNICLPHDTNKTDSSPLNGNSCVERHVLCCKTTLGTYRELPSSFFWVGVRNSLGL